MKEEQRNIAKTPEYDCFALINRDRVINIDHVMYS